MLPIKTNLVDSSFASPSFTLGGENSAEVPQLVEWDRTCSQNGPTFFTDKHLREVLTADCPGKRIALLIEPPSLSGSHYTAAWQLREKFDYILTFNSDFFTLNPLRVLFYPLGGSWIPLSRWGAWAGIKQSSKASIITSEKYGAPGHKLRHEIADWHPELYRYGRDVRPMKSKFDALAPFRFSVVVESVRINGYFSEKLIDCLSVGTTAIYWGAPDIQRWCPDNIIPFADENQLRFILANLSEYKMPDASKQIAVKLARSYRCAEDRIFLHYGSALWGKKIRSAVLA